MMRTWQRYQPPENVERNDRIAAFVRARMPFSEIAGQLGVTKSVVAGVAFRRGRTSGERSPIKRDPQKTFAPASTRLHKIEMSPPSSCRWITAADHIAVIRRGGDPFCGAPCVPGRPYCGKHLKLAVTVWPGKK